MNLCVSEATTMPASFADDVAAFADAGCPAMEVWLTKLEDHLKGHSVADTRALLKRRQITLAAASFQGGLLLSQGEERRAHFDHFRQRLELCEQFGIRTLVVAVDNAPAATPTDLARAGVSLRQAAQWAAGFNVRLALEFHGRSRLCASLDTALAMVASAGEANVGVCLDAFHYYTGPSKEQDLAKLTNENLAHVQLCDVAGVPREWATDSDRVLPGEGDFSLGPIVRRLREIGYNGWVSLELMNPTLWQTRPTQVVELGLEALRRVTRAN